MLTHLPREEAVHEPSCICLACGSTIFSRIGQDSARAGIRPLRLQTGGAHPAETDLPPLRDDRSGADAVPANRTRPGWPIEREVKERGAAKRPPIRQEWSAPTLADLRQLFDDALARTSAKGKLAVAICHSTARWTALPRWLEMSNNAAERAIRPLALGRRNWTFAGGQRAAALYAIIETAEINGLDVGACLADLIADRPINRIDELLPWAWRPLPRPHCDP